MECVSATAAEQGEQTETTQEGGSGLGNCGEIEQQVVAALRDGESTAIETVAESVRAVVGGDADEEVRRVEAGDRGGGRSKCPAEVVSWNEVERVATYPKFLIEALEGL